MGESRIVAAEPLPGHAYRLPYRIPALNACRDLVDLTDDEISERDQEVSSTGVSVISASEGDHRLDVHVLAANRPFSVWHRKTVDAIGWPLDVYLSIVPERILAAGQSSLAS